MPDFLQRMDGGEILGLVAILGGVLVVIVAIVMGVWSSIHWAAHQAALKREMLARGMSIDDIERLTMTSEERQAQLKADRKVREAEIAAGLKRDMLARGAPAEQPPESATNTPSRIEEEASALADTI